MLMSALDYGITEERFWNMTFSEVRREVSSKVRLLKIQAKERAIFDYTLAQLITKGVSQVLGDKSEYPTIEQVYPDLFSSEDVSEKQAKIEEKKQQLSIMRFKQFANFHNNNFKEVASEE